MNEKPSSLYDLVTADRSSGFHSRVTRDTPYPWTGGNPLNRITLAVWTHGLLATCGICDRTWFGSSVMAFWAPVLALMGDAEAIRVIWIHGIPFRHDPSLTRISGHKRGQS